ncbi:MAG: hypothetical protein WAT71_01935 [Ignavibacteria bacterium]
MKNQNDRNDFKPLKNFEEENEFLKNKLTNEFGMKDSDTSALPPEIENDWFNYICNFEALCENVKKIKISEAIGNPVCRKAVDLTDEEISKELDFLLELIFKSRVKLHFCCDYEDRTVYKFITEEFLERTIDDIRIEGLNTSFIYEDFYPNHEYDIRELAKDFFNYFLSKNWDEKHADFQIADTVLYER